MTSQILTEEKQDRLNEFADHLISQRDNFMMSLIRARENAGLTVETVADRMGAYVEKVHLFEETQDAPLSFITRYAFAIGAKLHLSIEEGFIKEN